MRIRLFVLLATMSALGCGDADVRSYTVPKPHAVEGFDSTTAPAKEYKILGAMFPADNPVWFFKASGPSDRIDEFEAQFDEFLKTLTFPDGPAKQPKWTVPDTVKVGPPAAFRVATLIYTINNQRVELVVSDAKGGLAANLERWAGQIGTEIKDVAKATKPITAGAVQGVKVSLTGPKNPSGAPMMAPR